MHDGREWSISLSLTATVLGSVLDFIAEAGRAKQREITTVLDREGIARAGVDLDDPIDLQVRDVSIHQALVMVLGQPCGYAVLRDGSVLVTSQQRVEEMAAKGEALAPSVLPGLWTAPAGAGRQVPPAHRDP